MQPETQFQIFGISDMRHWLTAPSLLLLTTLSKTVTYWRFLDKYVCDSFIAYLSISYPSIIYHLSILSIIYLLFTSQPPIIHLSNVNLWVITYLSLSSTSQLSIIFQSPICLPSIIDPSSHFPISHIIMLFKDGSLLRRLSSGGFIVPTSKGQLWWGGTCLTGE